MAKAEWAKTAALINLAVSILDAESPMTIRQLFYRIVSAGAIENSRGAYQTVSRVMTIARNDGRCDWEDIVDRSRPEYKPQMYADVDHFAKVVINSYRKDYWADQPNHIEVWTEKDAIIGSIEALTNELGITIRVGRGFSSTTKKHEIANVFEKIGRSKNIFVLYLGDFDPSGMAIEENLRYDIDADFQMHRLAIHKADIREFKLPPLRVKESDSRSPDFLLTHGDECVELDALPPTELRLRIDRTVYALTNQVKWQRAIAVEKVLRESIISSVELWNKLPRVPPA